MSVDWNMTFSWETLFAEGHWKSLALLSMFQQAVREREALRRYAGDPWSWVKTFNADGSYNELFSMQDAGFLQRAPVVGEAAATYLRVLQDAVGGLFSSFLRRTDFEGESVYSPNGGLRLQHSVVPSNDDLRWNAESVAAALGWPGPGFTRVVTDGDLTKPEFADTPPGGDPALFRRAVGPIQVGDVIGPWLFEEMRSAIRLMTTTFHVRPASYEGSVGDYEGGVVNASSADGVGDDLADARDNGDSFVYPVSGLREFDSFEGEDAEPFGFSQSATRSNTFVRFRETVYNIDLATRWRFGPHSDPNEEFGYAFDPTPLPPSPVAFSEVLMSEGQLGGSSGFPQPVVFYDFGESIALAEFTQVATASASPSFTSSLSSTSGGVTAADFPSGFGQNVGELRRFFVLMDGSGSFAYP